MNDDTRENLVAAGSLAALWAIRKNGGGALEQAGALGAIDGIHTGYVVTRNTGDERLGRRAGVRAGVRTGGWLLAAFTVPVVMFLGAVILGMAVPALNMSSNVFCFVWLPLCFTVFMVLAVKAGRAGQRNAYTRFNLPSEDEMNRSGYYEVEPDTWFNPVTDQVLTGHAYVRSEMRTWVRGDRSDDRAIRALYKQRRTFQAPQSPPQATHHVPKRYTRP